MSGSVLIDGKEFSNPVDKNWMRSEQVRDCIRVNVDGMLKAHIEPIYWNFGVGTSECRTMLGIPLKRNAELVKDLFERFGISSSNIIGIDRQKSEKETLYWSQRIQYIHGDWHDSNTWNQISLYLKYLEAKYKNKLGHIIYFDGFGGWVKDRAIFKKVAKELNPSFYYLTISRGLGNFDSKRFLCQLKEDMPNHKLMNTVSYNRPAKDEHGGVIPYSSTNLYFLQWKNEVPIYYGGDKYDVMNNCKKLVTYAIKNNIREEVQYEN